MTQYLLAPFRFLLNWLVWFIEDDGLAWAGCLAYIGLMSLLPFLVFVFTLLGLIGRADEGAGIVDMMFRFMPTEVALTLQEPVVQVVGTASGGVLTLSLVVVLLDRRVGRRRHQVGAEQSLPDAGDPKLLVALGEQFGTGNPLFRLHHYCHRLHGHRPAPLAAGRRLSRFRNRSGFNAVF